MANEEKPERRVTLMRQPPPDPNKSPIENALEVTELGVLGPDIFTNTREIWHPPGARGIYGGSMIAQCLAAGQKTVPDSFHVHSCHCYFLLAGSSEVPILFHVERVRDGRSFATRTVQARQRGRCIFTVTMSFVKSRAAAPEREAGGDKVKEVRHSSPFPAGERPPTEEQVAEEEAKVGGSVSRMGPFQNWKIRIVDSEGKAWDGKTNGKGKPETLRTRNWYRARGTIKGGKAAHLEALAYMSDSYFIGTVTRLHNVWRWPFGLGDIESLPEKLQIRVRKLLEYEGIKWESEEELRELKKWPKLGMMVSLDHSIYFHDVEGVRADQWMLCEMDSPWAGDGRGVVTQRIFDQSGRLLATCFQEGVVRLSEEEGEEVSTKDKGKEEKAKL